MPDNYQEPEFPNKYNGTSCPKAHLMYYLRKMARYSDSTPMLIHTFQDSLQGSALTWYISLDIEDFERWEDLANEFMRQYKFNIEVLPTRHAEKGQNENFRAFVQRWKAVASQVKPPIQEDELMELFLRSLPFEYYDKLYISDWQSFARLVKAGEKVERVMKEKKVAEELQKRQYPSRNGKEHADGVTLAPNTKIYPRPTLKSSS